MNTISLLKMHNSVQTKEHRLSNVFLQLLSL